jgi:WD40 repeat protein/serine/threonine protein kinase
MSDPTPTPPIESSRTMPIDAEAATPAREGATMPLGAGQSGTIGSDAQQVRRFFSEPEEPTERAGDEIGAYTLVSKLGEGGFGSVWLAERRKPFVQRVALKIIKAGMDSRGVITRFEQERQTLAVMNHPNVARVIDGGVTPAGGPYFVMEYVKGQSITEFCDARSLANRERLSLFIQVCEAVQHAHSKGIIHRDLKPGNILVSAADGEHPLVKVIDFGVAKALTQFDTDDLAKEEEGKMVGTPEYMSPEQAEADNERIDTRSDVYSLGVILYELVSGVLPFDSRELRSKSYREIQRTIREEAPPTLTARLSVIAEKDKTQIQRIARGHGESFEALLRDLKRELEWIPRKAMRREAKNRYQTSAAMAEDIRRYLDGRALEAAPDSATYRVRKYLRRHLALVVGSAAFLLALVVGLAAALWQWREASLARNEAVAAETRAVEQRNAAEAAKVEATLAKDVAVAAEAKAVLERKAADAARERVEAEAYIANIQMASAWLDSGRMGRVRERLEACPPSRRGWEWNWLDAQSDGSLLTLRAPSSGEVLLARFSPDGTQALTLSYDRSVRVWNMSTGEPIAELKGSGATLNDAVFSPDGRRIATACKDGTARVWDATTGVVVAELKGHARPVRAVAFDQDGSRVVTASEDGTARIWNAGTGALAFELKGHGDMVTALAFSPDGKRLATASADHSVRLWDPASGASLSELRGHDKVVSSLAWRADGGMLASGSADGTARLWSADGASTGILKGHQDAVMSLAFTADGRQILTGSLDRTARLWDVASSEPRSTLVGHSAAVMAVACSPDNRLAISASDDGTLRVWDLATALPLATRRGHADKVWSCAFSRDGTRVLTGSLDGTARLWETFPASPLREIPAHRGVVRMVSASPDGARFATASADGTARIWNAGEAAPAVMLQGHAGAVTSARFNADGSRVLTTSADNTARLWDARTGAQQGPLEGHAAAVTSARFSNDGGRVVTVSADQTARTWDAPSRRPLREFKGHSDKVNSARFSADGTRVITASTDKSARLWDASTAAMIREFKDPGGAVLTATLSEDGKRLLTVAADQGARVWDVESGDLLATMRPGDAPIRGATFSQDGSRVLIWSLQDRAPRLHDSASGSELLQLVGHEGGITQAEFAADGRRILTTSIDGSARVWDAQSGALLSTLRGTSGLGVTGGALLRDGVRIATASGDDGAVQIWDAVPARVRFAEGQFAQQGRAGNLGSDYARESQGEAAASWLVDPRSNANRPNFLRGTSASGPDAATLNGLVRQSLAEGRVGAALGCARAWGLDSLDTALLNALAWRGLTKLPKGDPGRDLDQILDCARLAAARTDRRDPFLLDTLAQVHLARGEHDRAEQVWRDALTLLESGPAPSAGEDIARREALKVSIRAALESAPDRGGASATAAPVR